MKGLERNNKTGTLEIAKSSFGAHLSASETHLASDHFGSNSLRSEGCWKCFSEEVEAQAPSHNSSLLDGLQG